MIKKTYPFLLLVLILTPNPAFSATFERTQLVFGDIELKIQISGDLGKQEAFTEIQKGFELAQKYNQIFSMYVANSEINRLNQSLQKEGKKKVSKELYEVLTWSKVFFQNTDGHFDITYEMKKSANLDFKIYPDKTIVSTNPKIKLNPTGLVKGYTVDQIVYKLRENPKIKMILVAAGGDIRQLSKSHEKSKIQLYHPTSKGKIKTITLTNQAISTSGFYERGRHIKNVRASSTEYLQVSVIADKCVISDALATAMMHMPINKIKKTLKHYPNTQVILYEKNGNQKIIQ